MDETNKQKMRMRFVRLDLKLENSLKTEKTFVAGLYHCLFEQILNAIHDLTNTVLPRLEPFSFSAIVRPLV